LRNDERLGIVDPVPSAAKKKVPTPKPEASDPARHTLDEAPTDDEPLTAADKRAVTRARRGAYVSNEEVRRKLGL
jgi:hypothetical protein